MKSASILVESLRAAGVKYVFGIPGAKIDSIFNELQDHPEIKLIVCRHEQNAGFLAAAVGRLSDTPGVCIATSGPGASNLATALATATTEGDPVVAVIGSVPRLLSIRHTHQSMRALDVLEPISKKAIAIQVEDQVAEAVLDAFRTAFSYPKGAAVLSLPVDVAQGSSRIAPFEPAAFVPPLYGPAARSEIEKVSRLVEQAKLPVLLLGMRATRPKVIAAVREFLKKHPIPLVETFQAAGAASRELKYLFFGRIGLFRNQPGDKLLAKSDLVLAAGYDPTEYDAINWNPSGNLPVIHIDYHSCSWSPAYRPKIELLGSLVENFSSLAVGISKVQSPIDSAICRELSKEFGAWSTVSAYPISRGPVQPLRFISLLQDLVPSDDTTVITDVGTVYIYIMRYFYVYQPLRLLSSNGQQTLGVGLPWAIAASLVQEPPCSQKVISLSGDGGFMFSSQELSTAVQQGCNITHFIWNDGGYNMVEFQEEMAYGRSSGVKLGGVDFVKFAEAFGAKGMRVSDATELEGVMKAALAYKGVVIVDVNIDYSKNQEFLAGHIIPADFR